MEKIQYLSQLLSKLRDLNCYEHEKIMCRGLLHQNYVKIPRKKVKFWGQHTKHQVNHISMKIC